MENKIIIEGEAPETDEEDETNINNEATPTRMTRSVQGAIIPGEASESEDEYGSISSAVSALTQPNLKPTPVVQEQRTEIKFNSLLHKKLQESNRIFHNNLQVFTNNVINEAAKDLTSTDQQLLKSQVTLQTAVTALRSLNQNASSLKDKLNIVLSSQFLPDVRLSQNE